MPGTTFFENSTAGAATLINQGGQVSDASTSGGVVEFVGSASAGNGTFVNSDDAVNGAAGGAWFFFDSSSAGNATFISCGGRPGPLPGGSLTFSSPGTSAGTATFFCPGGAQAGAGGSITVMGGNADHAKFILGGGEVSGAFGASAIFSGGGNGGNSTFILNGGLAAGAFGATLDFEASSGSEHCSAGNATLIANGGSSGGEGARISFGDSRPGQPYGGTPRIKIFGNGRLDISSRIEHRFLRLGSIEGDGLVFLGGANLAVGSNPRDTTFSGVIQDGGAAGGTGGSLTKLGPEESGADTTFTLGGANTYSGGTTINGGTLIVANITGSATGSGAVQINVGTLGGTGTVSGGVTIGSGGGAGAFLAPAHGTNRRATLTIQAALTLNADSAFTYNFKAKGNRAKTDRVIANGVTINGGATFNFQGSVQGTLQTGLTLTVISNTSTDPISGTFSNLPDGAVVTIGGNNLQADYEGGDGNDLTLTVVP